MTPDEQVQRLMGLAHEATQEEILAGIAMGLEGYRPERFDVAGKWKRLETALREALSPPSLEPKDVGDASGPGHPVAGLPTVPIASSDVRSVES